MKKGNSVIFLFLVLVILLLSASQVLPVGYLSTELDADSSGQNTANTEAKCSEISIKDCLNYDECEIKKFTQIYLKIFKKEKERCTKKPIPVCGNDIVEGNEECDETDFGTYG